MSEQLSQAQHDSLDGVLAPAETPGLIGHEAQAARVLRAIEAGKLPHGLILSGPKGIGKATFAFHLARRLAAGPAAAGRDFASADVASPLFRQVASGAHPQVLHLTRPATERGAGFKTVLAVDEIRKIGEFLSMTSGDGGYRIVIIDPADDLRAAAANAVLKNLEEPPRKTVFLLISHSAGRLLPTIRSRCQLLRFEPLSDAQVAAAMQATGVEAGGEEERLQLAAQAGGSVRKAILLSQFGGLDIVAALDDAVRNPGDIPLQHKLADAVSGRDREAQFAIFNDRALEALADAASRAAGEGDIHRANSIADAWQEARIAIPETETYNLDQRQHALTMIGRLNRMLAGDFRRM